MEWIWDHWSIFTTLAAIASTVLGYYGKAKWGKVVTDLVNSIERANASDVKAMAQSASVKSGTDKTLAKVVKKLTE